MDKEYLEGIRIIYFIGFSYVLYGLYYFNAMGMLFTNKTGKISQLVIISALVNIALNFILIPPFGMMGAAIATVCGYLVMFIQGRIYCQSYYPITRNNRFEITQIGLIFAMLVVMTWMASTIREYLRSGPDNLWSGPGVSGPELPYGLSFQKGTDAYAGTHPECKEEHGET